jgi:hypothetical protein
MQIILEKKWMMTGKNGETFATLINYQIKSDHSRQQVNTMTER